MMILNKKIFLAVLSTVFFSSVSYARPSNESRDLDDSQGTPHSVPPDVMKAVEENKCRVLEKLSDKKKLKILQKSPKVFSYGRDFEGRRPGDKNYGAAESDSLIKRLKRMRDRDITWGFKNFKAMSSSEMDKYMRAINYTESW